MRQKTRVFALLLASFMSTQVGAVSDPSLDALLNFEESHPATNLSTEEIERLKIIKAKAKTLGIQSGAHHASKAMMVMLNEMAVKLDSIYDFGRLGVVTPYKGAYLVSPVVLEIEKSINLASDSRSFIVRDQTFIISKEPYITLTPPTWRTYLTFSVEPPRLPEDMIKPKTAEEKAAWRSELLSGYEMGIKQVEDVTVARFARLGRDVVGMKRFELLRQRKVISDIKIADAYYPVSGGGNRLDVNESRVSIDVNPQLNSNRWNWETIPRLSDISDLFPKGMPFEDWTSSDE